MNLSKLQSGGRRARGPPADVGRRGHGRLGIAGFALGGVSCPARAKARGQTTPDTAPPKPSARGLEDRQRAARARPTAGRRPTSQGAALRSAAREGCARSASPHCGPMRSFFAGITDANARGARLSGEGNSRQQRLAGLAALERGERWPPLPSV